MEYTSIYNLIMTITTIRYLLVSLAVSLRLASNIS